MTENWLQMPKRLDDAVAAILAALDRCYDRDIVRGKDSDRPGRVDVDSQFQADGTAIRAAFDRLTAIYQQRVQPYHRHDEQWIKAKNALFSLLPGVPEIQEQLEKSRTHESWKGRDAELYRQRSHEQFRALSDFRTVRDQLLDNLEEAVVLHRALQLSMATNLENVAAKLNAAIDTETEYARSTHRCADLLSQFVPWFESWTNPDEAPWGQQVAAHLQEHQRIDKIALMENHTWPGAPKPRQMTGRGRPTAY